MIVRKGKYVMNLTNRINKERRKVRVGIELPDKNICNIDLSKPFEGNPGVGGSEFLFVLLAYYLNKHYCNTLELCIYHYSENQLQNEIKNVIVKDEYDLLKTCEKDGVDVLIHQVSKTQKWYMNLSQSMIKSIAWAHIYLSYDEMMNIKKCSNVSRVVFVGKEEYDTYIDDDIIEKSEYVYNMLNTKDSVGRKDIYTHEVTYVGSLVPAKGFHVLAKIWPKVLEKIPDAKLNVIGSGRVYDRNAKLGDYGIAQSDYENKFIPYLLNSKGELDDSVRFYGLMGKEKTDILTRTAVGVVNPTALTETFCMSAIEMELVGIPVVSKKKWGLLDTVAHKKTGYLFKTERQFVKCVVKLLRDNNTNKEMGNMGKEYVRQKFEADCLIEQWLNIIKDVYYNIKPIYNEPKGNYLNDYKWIRMLNRFLRFHIHLKFIPSVLEMKNYIKHIIK